MQYASGRRTVYVWYKQRTFNGVAIAPRSSTCAQCGQLEAFALRTALVGPFIINSQTLGPAGRHRGGRPVGRTAGGARASADRRRHARCTTEAGTETTTGCDPDRWANQSARSLAAAAFSSERQPCVTRQEFIG